VRGAESALNLVARAAARAEARAAEASQ